MGKVYIIAEAGVNHNGSLEKAKRLCDVAKKAGADVIKFQTGKVDLVTTKWASQAEYQKVNNKNELSQAEMLKNLTLKFEDFIPIYEYCKKIDMAFMSTPFDMEAVEFLRNLDMPFMKVPSGEITNYPYLKAVAKAGLPVILSTGMSNIDEVKWAKNLLIENGLDKDKLTILHCVTDYPAPLEQVNIFAMKHIEKETKARVGYSDHTLGFEASLTAVALGASVIEKHFTLDKGLPGPDHVASLEPDELSQFVRQIRNVEKCLEGSGIKEIQESEKRNLPVARRSIVARKDLKKGETFSIDNIIPKRPGVGVSPIHWEEIIGKVARRDYLEDDLISDEELD